MSGTGMWLAFLTDQDFSTDSRCGLDSYGVEGMMSCLAPQVFKKAKHPTAKYSTWLFLRSASFSGKEYKRQMPTNPIGEITRI